MCVVHRRPHLQFDQIVTAVKLVTEIAAPTPRGADSAAALLPFSGSCSVKPPP
jgi:hypothetical protein